MVETRRRLMPVATLEWRTYVILLVVLSLVIVAALLSVNW